jgi:phosphate/sulfate permease
MTFIMLIGLVLATWSVIANDAVQCLGTFINSNQKTKWYYLWAAASAVLVCTVVYGWSQGDMSYGRLEQFPIVDITWVHVAAPAVLLLLTLCGIPVSTTFLVLSVFASSIVMEKMLLKSFVGYSLAAVSGYLIWYLVCWIGGERSLNCPESEKRWRVAQWFTTGFLWFSWLNHDMANIAIFVPRELGITTLSLILFICVTSLGMVFYFKGGKIQKIVTSKVNTQYVKNATLVDLAYASLLYYFKELNSIPMSTTWVFVGLLCGRELAVSSYNGKDMKEVWPIVGADFLKIMLGLGVSILLVYVVNGI